MDYLRILRQIPGLNLSFRLEEEKIDLANFEGYSKQREDGIQVIVVDTEKPASFNLKAENLFS
jgi:hypothetical protein